MGATTTRPSGRCPESAINRGADRAARLNESRRLERAHAVYEIALWDDSEVVEARGTLHRHSIVGAERQLGRDFANGARDRRSEDAVEDGNGCGSRHDEERPPADIFDLTPPDFATPRIGHQGSSRIASRSELIAACRSASVG